MTISGLAETLRAVSAALESAQGTLAGPAATSIEQAGATLASVRRDDGFHPVELDQAAAELARAVELVARARQAVDDYRMRL
ncbi:hypothetical protein [Actinokineospora pegani]|uniref:hypothetical protein n=1 Tax=Actinokineospora pegani TaxID=2654637 RepID=UPI0012E9F5E0|nr:hypothetical protein [Actinokineospora pegani]